MKIKNKNSQNKWSSLNHLTIEYISMLEVAYVTEPSGPILAYDCTEVGSPKIIKNNKKQNDENRKKHNEITFGPMKLLEKSYKAGLSNCSYLEFRSR